MPICSDVVVAISSEKIYFTRQPRLGCPCDLCIHEIHQFLTLPKVWECSKIDSLLHLHEYVVHLSAT